MDKINWTKRQKHYMCFKRLMDIILSLFAIIVLSSFLLIIGILIKLTSKGPMFYVQERVGKNEKIFKIIKFRTMKIDAPEIPSNDWSPEDLKNSLTKFGNLLRKTSIDELPQIFNIFVGNMSIVGPRPVIQTEDALINERNKYSPSPFLLLPGLTGYAQTYGKNIDPITKAELDFYYIQNISFKLDVLIFFRTFKVLFKPNSN